MSFPSITFKHTRTDEAKHLEELVTHKFATLAKYIGNEPSARCEVEFQKEAPHQSGLVYRVEVNVSVKGKFFRAEATDETFEKAIDVVRSELDTELRKAHSKRESLVRRGGRKMKDMLRWGK
ncbi:HPF/RaiA family ribosome-associated protein [Patescibacteria group bacterium]|nr:HPF/RaiA family ribosome-associated protein [Patescibacteria group bacterium]